MGLRDRDPDRAVSRTEIKRLLSEFNTRIGAIESRALAWTLTEDGWGALSPGLERSYRRLVRAQAGARQTKAEDDVHDWRKRAKDHWYHTVPYTHWALPKNREGEQPAVAVSSNYKQSVCSHILNSIPTSRADVTTQSS